MTLGVKIVLNCPIVNCNKTSLRKVMIDSEKDAMFKDRNLRQMVRYLLLLPI